MPVLENGNSVSGPGSSPTAGNGSPAGQAEPSEESLHATGKHSTQNGSTTTQVSSYYGRGASMEKLSPFAVNNATARKDADGEGPDASPTLAAPQRMVSWPDQAHGQELFTVREFEPSEGGDDPGAEDSSWETERKSCCSVM